MEVSDAQVTSPPREVTEMVYNDTVAVRGNTLAHLLHPNDHSSQHLHEECAGCNTSIAAQLQPHVDYGVMHKWV